MGAEASKLRERWQREGLWDRYFVGKKVLDIGCGGDKIVPDADGWDKEQGDGKLLTGVPDGKYDVVFSSHFVEHVTDPVEALLNQWRVLKDGGHIIFQVPDEDLYEQGIWPSHFNSDHKHTFTISKHRSWSPACKSVAKLVEYLPDHKVISMRIVDTKYDYTTNQLIDQTGGLAEAAVEVIVQKLPLQLTHQCGLKQAWMCPTCKHMEMVCTGIGPDEKYLIWCKNCGNSGKLSVDWNK